MPAIPPGAERSAALFDAVPFDAVLFDMDGVLVDSTASVERSWQRLGEQRGLAPDALRAARGHGRPAREILCDLLPDSQVPDALREIERLEMEDADGLLLLPGAAEALATVADRAAIATSCTAPLARARIAASGLVAPAVLVTADDVARGKPDPEPYLLAAQRLGADPARCLVVEDAPSGLASARAAGCRTLAVTTTHDVVDLEADAVVPDLSAVRFEQVDGGVRVSDADTADTFRHPR